MPPNRICPSGMHNIAKADPKAKIFPSIATSVDLYNYSALYTLATPRIPMMIIPNTVNKITLIRAVLSPF